MLRGVLKALPTISMRHLSVGMLARPSFVMPRFVKSQEFISIHAQPLISTGSVTREIHEINKTFESINEDVEDVDKTVYLDSVLRKRRLKMKKHKLRKRRRDQRALKKRLGKL